MSEFVIVVVSLAIYFFPSIVGYGKRNFSSILLLNLFLGWTVIGWIVSIVWAVSYEKPIEKSLNRSNYDNVTDQLLQLKELYDDGTLTKEEFEKEKRRILK